MTSNATPTDEATPTEETTPTEEATPIEEATATAQSPKAGPIVSLMKSCCAADDAHEQAPPTPKLTAEERAAKLDEHILELFNKWAEYPTDYEGNELTFKEKNMPEPRLKHALKEFWSVSIALSESTIFDLEHTEDVHFTVFDPNPHTVEKAPAKRGLPPTKIVVPASTLLNYNDFRLLALKYNSIHGDIELDPKLEHVSFGPGTIGMQLVVTKRGYVVFDAFGPAEDVVKKGWVVASINGQREKPPHGASLDEALEKFSQDLLKFPRPFIMSFIPVSPRRSIFEEIKSLKNLAADV